MIKSFGDIVEFDGTVGDILMDYSKITEYLYYQMVKTAGVSSVTAENLITQKMLLALERAKVEWK